MPYHVVMQPALFFVAIALPSQHATTVDHNTTPAKSKFSRADVKGKYYFGDGLGVNCTLELGPEGKFKFQWAGCMGVYGKNSGTYELTGEKLIAHPTQPNKDYGMATSYYPIRWGGNMYLVAENQILRFVKSVAAGEEMASGGRPREFYRRHFGSFAVPDQPNKGIPDVPSAYRKYLEEAGLLPGPPIISIELSRSKKSAKL